MKILKNPLSVSEFLHSHGLKATPARLALLSVFQHAKKPLSITALEELLAKEEINSVTFYRIVDDFLAAGIVRPIDLRHGHAHYELITQEEHHHLVCTNCGKINDITHCLPDNFEAKTLRANPDFARIHDHSLELFGVCKKCASK
jgi:Fe2+ or Zn2+ uptake regulation protein